MTGEPAHLVTVTDGAEYEGETYIRCVNCGVGFDNGWEGLPALVKFLEAHEVIPVRCSPDCLRVRELAP